MATVEEINDENKEIYPYNKALEEDEEEEKRKEKKYNPEAVFINNIIQYSFFKILDIADPYLPKEVKKEANLVVKEVFSTGNIESALKGDFSPIVDKTKEIGINLFSGIVKGVVDLASNYLGNGVKFLSGIINKFADNIIKKAQSYGAPKKTVNEMTETQSNCNKMLSITYSAKNIEEEQQEKKLKPLSLSLNKALSEIGKLDEPAKEKNK